jgi:hypothetical protein
MTMPNGIKKISSAFASCVLLAASALVATPAPAQTGGGGAGGGSACYCQYASHLGGCEFYSDGQYHYEQCCEDYRYYIIGPPPPECEPYLYSNQPDEEPSERPSEETAEPAGR